MCWNSEAADESALGQQIQAVYSKHMPPDQAHPYATHHPSPQGEKTSRWQQEIDQSGLFESVRSLQFPWTQRYTTAQYLQLLETYSDHRVLPSETKHKLFDSVTAILEQHGGGRRKPCTATLYLTQVRK